ncbi:MAG: hypothetical protein MI784_11905, partial [Cytophagales bacterium]|nr:hypothetical protein [Cytophagales bacterium]
FSFEYMPVTTEVDKVITYNVKIYKTNGEYSFLREVKFKVNPGPPTVSFKDNVSKVTRVAGEKQLIQGSVYSPTKLTSIVIKKGDQLIKLPDGAVDLAKKTFTYEFTTSEKDTEESNVEFKVFAMNEGTGTEGVDSLQMNVEVLTKHPVVSFDDDIKEKAVVAYDTAVFSGSVSVLEGAKLDNIKIYKGSEELDKKFVKIDLAKKTFKVKYPAKENEVGDVVLTVHSQNTYKGVAYETGEKFPVKVTTAKPVVSFKDMVKGIIVKKGTQVVVTGSVASASDLTAIAIYRDGKKVNVNDFNLDINLDEGMFSYTFTPEKVGNTVIKVEAGNGMEKKVEKGSAKFVVTAVD